jgi:hypothetical protein
LDACVFLKVSEFDNSAELKNLVVRSEGTRNELSKTALSALSRLIEKTARYCETREVSKLEVELPQTEHGFISLFLQQGFRVAAIRERYYPGQSVCILEKKVGGTYYSDPFESVQLGKWLLHAILPCKVEHASPFQFKDSESVPRLHFEIYPSHVAFSKANPVGFDKRLQGWMIILDELDLCTAYHIRQIARSAVTQQGQLHYVLTQTSDTDMRSIMDKAGISCFQMDEVRAIAGGERSSLSIPMERSEVGGVFTVLEQERIVEYARHDQFVYYLLSGIGGALPGHSGGNEPTCLLVVYCPTWSDGNSGVVAIAEIDEIADSSFDEAFRLYDNIPKALTAEDLAYYRIRSDKDRLHVLKCSQLQVFDKTLEFDDAIWTRQRVMRDYICRELEETNSSYIDYQTCEMLRQHASSHPVAVVEAQKRMKDASIAEKQIVMRILFLAANPAETKHLDLEEELRSLERELRGTKFRDLIRMVPQHAVRPDDLVAHVREHSPNVIHFSGHGSPHGIILRNDAEQFQAVSGESLKRFLEGRSVDLVVLNACYSKFQADAISGVVKAVVGTTDAIGDEAARRFTVAFYRSLGNGFSIREAFRDGGDAVELHGLIDVFQSSGDLDLTLVPKRARASRA